MIQLFCGQCKKTYSGENPIWRCPCGGFLDLVFQPQFDLKAIKNRKPSLWRYREAIPIMDDKNIVTFDEGFTPLLPVSITGHKVLIKQEQLFPSGSFKDRGAAVMISHIKALGIENVVEDSSGNAGSAVAAYCARAGIECRVFVPDSTSPGKLNQIKGYGASIYKVPGNREDTSAAVLHAANNTYYASHIWNPFFYHGTKTFAFELSEQLGWKVPDRVILPVGHGTLLMGAYIGFQELKAAGVIQDIPRLIAVQVENYAPLYQAFINKREEIHRVKGGKTVAEGIAISFPVRGKQILKAVRESGGNFVIVSETEIKEALWEMGHKGYCIEPTSAATVAGIKKHLRQSPAGNDEVLASVFTGHGLKVNYNI